MTKSNPKIKPVPDLRQAAIDAHHKGGLDQARDLYRAYLQNNPKDAAIWSNLGALFRKQKNYELAVAAQLRALELEPETLALMNNAANAFYDAGYIDRLLDVSSGLGDVSV